MDHGTSELLQRPFPREAYYPKDDIKDLQDRDRFDSAIKVLGQEVPEDLGPEEAVDASGDLIWRKDATCGQLSR